MCIHMNTNIGTNMTLWHLCLFLFSSTRRGTCERRCVVHAARTGGRQAVQDAKSLQEPLDHLRNDNRKAQFARFTEVFSNAAHAAQCARS